MGPRDGLNDSKKKKSLSFKGKQNQTFHLSSPSHYCCVLITVQRDATQSSLFIILQFTLHVSGVNHTHHQEYTKL